MEARPYSSTARHTAKSTLQRKPAALRGQKATSWFFLSMKTAFGGRVETGCAKSVTILDRPESRMNAGVLRDPFPRRKGVFQRWYDPC
jgi:hypothetical protein